jgi:hypothetical protein
MATVYEALDDRRGRVAAKVLRSKEPDDVAIFRAEQRLSSRVDAKAIVPIHDAFTTGDGFAGCTMELVAGATLEELLHRGEVSRDRAVAVVASTALGLAAVHDAGIVHRDVKPANLFVEPTGTVRILDFGVARDLRAPPDPRDSAIAGTPRYFAPEQAEGSPTTPSTDVWALGVVLYELLVGVPPFGESSLPQLIYQITSTEPRAPRSLNPGLGPAVEAIVLRCLEKDPARRFPDARGLAAALEAVLRGTVEEALAPIVVARLDPATARVPPAPPLVPKPPRASAQLHYHFSFDLAASPEALWPLVSNTEKFNKAIGLPPVEFRDEPDGAGGVVRTGRFRRLGMTLEWTEHPFEWVAPYRQSVLRTYTRGPFETLWNEVTLTRAPGGGTTLVHAIDVAPRGPLGRLAGFLEIRLNAKARIEEAYRQLDRHAMAAHPGVHDAYARPVKLSAENEARFARGLAALGTDKKAARLAPLLAGELLQAPDIEASRVRPYALAKRWLVPKREALELCVAATRAGLLELSWHLLCPICRVPTRALDSLGNLREKNHCDACDVTYDNDFASSVELAFRTSHWIRPLSGETYCLGGPGHFSHVLAQQELEPGETRTLELDLARGSYRVAVRGMRSSYPFEAEDLGFDPLDSGRTTAPRGAVGLAVVIEEATVRPGPLRVPAGVVRLVLENRSARRRVVRIENAAWRQDVLSALEACGNPGLQELQASLALAEPIRLSRGTYLAASLAPEALAQAVQDQDGTLLPGSPPLAVFARPKDAVELALRLRRAADAPRLAVHSGPALVAAFKGSFDHRGPGPGIARELLEETQPGEIATTHIVLGSPGVSDLVGECPTRVQRKRLGAEGSLSVIYLGPAPPGELSPRA